MKNDLAFAQALKSLDIVASVAMCQAQGHLARTFKITSRTAAKATDRIFNGTTDKQGKKIAPLLLLSENKTHFIDVNAVEWHEKRVNFEVKARAQESGVLVYLSSARHKRNVKKLNEKQSS